ncbi:Abi family protein [Eggerthellaceae bacterium zg-997]|nr:Abi family protein [Eggerthellaceae bacterium zg-997]
MKEFKSIAEQVDLLKSRGLTIDQETSTVLLRDNYYSIVNGYKDPFLDRQAMQAHAEDVYKRGTHFNSLYSLFLFDRELRRITFFYISQAEAALKTATVYAFCSKHRRCRDYLNQNEFTQASDMLVPKGFRGDKSVLFQRNMTKLINIMEKKTILKPWTKPFTRHYLETHRDVPLWVLANEMSFGNMSHFFQLMKRQDQIAVCKNLAVTTYRLDTQPKLTPHVILRAYDVLVHFRNLCAHGERLYCARHKGAAFPDMIRLLEAALPQKLIAQMRNEVDELASLYESKLQPSSKLNLEDHLGLNRSYTQYEIT